MPRDRIAWIALPLGILAYHLATLTGYGIFRDELYYLACADRLAWGYVDHPPLSIGVLAAFRALFGDSVEAIRIPAALAGAGTALLSASIARGLGGGAFAQRLAAAAASVFPIGMALAGFYSMNALDLLFWSAALRVLVAILAGANPRLWLLFGALCGLGLENKISVLFLGLGVVAGLLAARRFEPFRERWIWLGGAVAIVLFLPHLLWQAANGFPTLEFMENARRYKMVGLDPLGFLAEAALNAGPPMLPIWVGGLWLLLARPEGRPFRALGFLFLAVFLVMAGTGSKPYYVGAAFPLLYAAGSVLWERVTERRGRSFLRAGLYALVLASALFAAPLTKGILPVETFVAFARTVGFMPSSGERHETGRLPQHFADMHGWEALARTVAGVRDGLPEDERDEICVFGQNYGQAGAIDYFGPSLGLPRAVSGHNAYWHWGPRDCAGKTWLVIGDDRETLESIFESVELGATFDCDLCMPYEDDNPIWVCRGLRGSVDELWRRAKKFI